MTERTVEQMNDNEQAMAIEMAAQRLESVVVDPSLWLMAGDKWTQDDKDLWRCAGAYLAMRREGIIRDAERYRKLRALHWSDYKLTVTNGDSVMLGHDTFSGDRLDAAIDNLN